MITVEQLSHEEGIKRLQKLSKAMPPKVIRKVLAKASKVYSSAAKATSPVYKGKSGEHHRYNTSKITNKLKAPKGMGNIVATYKSGNLKRSIKKLAARKLIRAVMIGPKRAKGNTGGVFSGNRTDGFYANMLEGGTKHIEADPRMENAWNKTKTQVINTAIRGFQEVIISKTQTL